MFQTIQKLALEKQRYHLTLLEKWCGQRLYPAFVYAIRVYKDKTTLQPHRDRVDTHIVSAIINVGQKVVEDGPLILEENYYRSHRVVIEPGDTLFYEGARLAHGRSIALNGKSFANIFCHLRPAYFIVVGRNEGAQRLKFNQFHAFH